MKADTLTKAPLLHSLELSQNPDVKPRNHSFQCTTQTSAKQKWLLKIHKGLGLVFFLQFLKLIK